jgi:hypothetical protein
MPNCLYHKIHFVFVGQLQIFVERFCFDVEFLAGELEKDSEQVASQVLDQSIRRLFE